MKIHKAILSSFCLFAFLTVPTPAADLLPPSIFPASGSVRSPFLVTFTNLNTVGTIFYTLDGSDPSDSFGHVSPAARSYSDPVSLARSTFVRARVKFGPVWSDLATAPFTTDQDFSGLLFTEIMFHPTDDTDSPEFIELKNVGWDILDMTGLTLVDEGYDEIQYRPLYSFPPGSRIHPGEIYLLTLSPDVFREVYPGIPFQGTLLARMNNGGSRLTIRRGDAVAAKARYDTHSPWQVVPDNHGYFFNSTNAEVEEVGFSLVRTSLDPVTDPTHFTTWRASARRLGSPGADDPLPTVLPIYINEVLARSSTLPDTIEFYNPNSVDIDLGGWWLSDERNSPYRYKIPAGNFVPAQGYLTLDDSAFGQGTNAFSFSAEGDRCYLFSGAPSGQLTGFSHGFHFGASDRDVSFGRVLRSDLTEDFPAQLSLTLGLPNSPPRFGPVVISEISYHPSSGEVEFIELRNLSPNPVPFWDPSRPQLTWAMGYIISYFTLVSYNFPANTTIPANGIIVLAEGSPDAFRSRHSIPPEVQLFPLVFKLSNGGEGIALLRPSGLSGGNPRYVQVDGLEYDDELPWPPAADGGGVSLERLSGFGNEPLNWRPNPHGISPGRHTATNLPPRPWAGGPRLAFLNRPIQLTGLVDDDLWPGRTVTSTWSFPDAQLPAGPAAGLTNVFTTTFSSLGSFRAVLAATDTEFTSQDESQIQVIIRPFEQWLAQNFTPVQLQDPTFARENSDPDLDGLSNLEEYLFDLAPRIPDSSRPLRVYSGAEGFRLRWTQRVTAPDVEVRVELAHTLSGPWFGGPGLFTVQEIVIPGGLKEVTLTSLTFSGRSTHQFIRFSLIAL